MASPEIGPYADHGTWKPSVITSTAPAQARRPVWAPLCRRRRRPQADLRSRRVSWLDPRPWLPRP